MATHESALKRNRQNQKRKLRNKVIRSKMKTSVKSLFAAAEGTDKSAVPGALRETIATLAKTASRGVIHKKTASRKISRLTKRVNTMLKAG